ncbi:MAG: pyridine nucleotide-disulfide oxidoreductase [Thermoprotei archaeon]|nr:MAG: pyridine nucleotide-disulfide oxidoreductase [Thermoprotei archaeon]
MYYDVVVIGGGPAGLAAAIRAKELGLKTILLENTDKLGGIPLQCVHTGFGLHYFKEDLTGTEFIYRFIRKAEQIGLEYKLRTYALELDIIAHDEKIIKALSPEGSLEISTKTVIYAAGARERHVFEVNIVGDRPSGIYTAGEAQAMMDLYGALPGRRIVIVGSGDVGLIMARRFALEGAKVMAVVEIMPWPGGLLRNVVQCLEDYDIPLLLSHVVLRVHGKERVEKVVIAQVDERLRPVPGTEKEIECDTVIIATGLVPNIELLERIGVAIDPATRGPKVNELLETSIPGIFAAGNALVINDLVDYTAEQGERAAEGARIFVDNDGIPSADWKPIEKGRNVRLVVPHYISGERDVKLYLRVQKPERDVYIRIPEINKRTFHPKVMPSEMVTMELSKEELRDIGEKITIEVIRRGEL